MKRNRNRLRWILLFTAAGLACVSVAVFAVAETPPHEAMTQLRHTFSHTRRAEAGKYAPHLLARAQDIEQVAWKLWRLEGERWFPLRRFRAVEDTARAAIALARQAAVRAAAVQDSLRWEAIAGMALGQRAVEQRKTVEASLPGDRAVQHRLIKIEIWLLECREAYERHDLWTAAEKARDISEALLQNDTHIKAQLARYLEQIPVWQKMVRDTIAWSAANRRPALIVDKLAKECRVYIAGRLHSIYAAEFGPVWMGDKQRQGDNRTPEGRYYVKKKKSGSQTIYYKALEIDYPNKEDYHRFMAAKTAGIIPKYAKIGRLIEIHGEGGRGKDWTAGCVALQNRDMETVFQLAQVGTPVTIVGTTAARADRARINPDGS